MKITPKNVIMVLDTETADLSGDVYDVGYTITDKTGTLTQNDMVLKKVCTEFAIFEAEDTNNDFLNILQDSLFFFKSFNV